MKSKAISIGSKLIRNIFYLQGTVTRMWACLPWDISRNATCTSNSSNRKLEARVQVRKLAGERRSDCTIAQLSRDIVSSFLANHGSAQTLEKKLLSAAHFSVSEHRKVQIVLQRRSLPEAFSIVFGKDAHNGLVLFKKFFREFHIV